MKLNISFVTQEKHLNPTISKLLRCDPWHIWLILSSTSSILNEIYSDKANTSFKMILLQLS